MKRSIGIAIAIAVGISIGLTLTACSPPPPPPEPVRAVKLIKVLPAAVTHDQVLAAEVKPAVETRLAFRVGGKILRRHVALGQHVKSGQLLAELDPADLALASQAAAAQWQAAKTQHDLVQAELERYQGLRRQGFISAAELQRREASAAAAESTLRQANAQQAIQGNQARYARLEANADGVITGLDAEVGQVVSAGAPVVRLAHDGERDAVFFVAEDQIDRVVPGQPAKVTFWSRSPGTSEAQTAGPAPALEGVVRERAAAADAVTRTYQVKVALPDGADVPLGATASVRLEAPADSDASGPLIMVPTSALMRSSADGKPVTQVWVYDEAQSTVAPRAVRLGAPNGNLIPVTEGLKPGEEIVAAGAHVLSPGQKVTRYASPGVNPSGAQQ